MRVDRETQGVREWIRSGCYPHNRGQQMRLNPDSRPVRAMLVYNLLIALFLVYLFAVGHIGGVLLWPGVALHAAMALLLFWAWRTELPSPVTTT